MNKIIFCLIVCSITFTSYAQFKLPIDTVINKGTYRDEGTCIYLNVFDTNYVSLIRGNYRNKSNPYLIINNDTSRVYAFYPMYLKDIILFEVHSKANDIKKLVYYKLKDKSFCDLNFIKSKEGCLLDKSFTKCYSKLSDKNGIKLYLLDPLNKEKNIFADFSDYNQFKYADYSSIERNFAGIEQVYFFSNNEAFVKLGYNKEPSVGYEDYKYFLVRDMDKKELTSKIIPKELKNIANPYINSSIQFSSSNKEYFRECFNGSGILKNRLITKQYDIISDILLIGKSYLIGDSLNYIEHSKLINGINIQKGIIENYFLNSILNNEKKVIIPYKFIPKLDIAMYKLYNNFILHKKDLKGFGKYELGILRNLIFAKYNYDFSSEFYQAYFNLYAFYNNSEMLKNRTKNVSNKLTNVDKQNLKLIKIME